MLEIAVVDNELIWQKKIITQINTYYDTLIPPMEININTYLSGEEFLDAPKSYDIVFMDLDMKELSGFETAKKYKALYPDSILIILTIHAELSRVGYHVDAFRYLDKNLLHEIPEALESAHLRLQHQRKMTFSILNFGDMEIALKDILHIDSIGRQSTITTTHTTFCCQQKISDLTSLLDSDGFYLLRRGQLVNLEHIIGVTTTHVTLSNGENYIVSRRRAKEFHEAFLQWKFQHGNG